MWTTKTYAIPTPKITTKVNGEPMKKWKEQFNKEYQIENEVDRGMAEFFYEQGWTRAIEILESKLHDEHREGDEDES